MSRAGKFIPGGAGKGDGPAGAKRTGVIRAPVDGAAPEQPGAKKPTPGKVSSLVKPVAKNQRLPIVIMSGVVCCLLVIFAFYEFEVVPAKNDAEAMKKQRDDAIAAQQAAADAAKKAEEERLAAQQTLRATVTVDTKPAAASITVGDEHKTAPASFTDLKAGKYTVLIHADGYQDYKQDITVTTDKPTDLGTIELVLKAGTLALTSPQIDVQYSLTGPNNYSQEGQVPANLDKLPIGDYVLTVWQHDWKLPAQTITIHDQENVQKEIKFPYANVSLTSEPSGATVRQGHTVLGRTPLTIPNLRPGNLPLSFDLAPYTTLRLTLPVPEFGNVSKSVTLKQDKDFIAASGMAMVWIPDGGYWAGKYLVQQSEYEKVAGATNPSTFRKSNRPVETIPWESAASFCDKMTAYERKAGRLPNGFHYTLPTESQWTQICADADVSLAATSRITPLSSTQDVGFSEPNKYGLFDTIGNVWEWCLDADAGGNHSMRGGSWLSTAERFPSAETTTPPAPPKYIGDKFIGFRLLLVPD